MQYKDEKILHFNKILGKVVKQLRMEKGISANKFANEFDLSSGNSLTSHARNRNTIYKLRTDDINGIKRIYPEWY